VDILPRGMRLTDTRPDGHSFEQSGSLPATTKPLTHGIAELRCNKGRACCQWTTRTLAAALSNHMPERQLLFDPTAKDFRCSECAWVWAIPHWLAADFSYERALGDAFNHHVCGEYALLAGSSGPAL
jgi:hypothetical protein